MCPLPCRAPASAEWWRRRAGPPWSADDRTQSPQPRVETETKPRASGRRTSRLADVRFPAKTWEILEFGLWNKLIILIIMFWRYHNYNHFYTSQVLKLRQEKCTQMIATVRYRKMEQMIARFLDWTTSSACWQDLSYHYSFEILVLTSFRTVNKFLFKKHTFEKKLTSHIPVVVIHTCDWSEFTWDSESMSACSLQSNFRSGDCARSLFECASFSGGEGSRGPVLLLSMLMESMSLVGSRLFP